MCLNGYTALLASSRHVTSVHIILYKNPTVQRSLMSEAVEPIWHNLTNSTNRIIPPSSINRHLDPVVSDPFFTHCYSRLTTVLQVMSPNVSSV
jgi:hypothetical protein